MKPISVTATEAGVVRVFALSMDDAAAQSLKTGDALAQTFGGAALDATHVEVFALADLGEMSLPDYLIEGAGVQQAALESDRAKLNALSGSVMVIYSSAFGGKALELTPDRALTLIGSYPQEGTDWTGAIDLSTPSALPKTPEGPAKKRPSDAAMSGRIAMLALLVAFGVVGLMVWVGS